MAFKLSKVDDCDHGIQRIHEIKRNIVSRRTIRQLVEIDEYENFGIGVCLDGWPQCAQIDGDKYHQAFVHQALLPLLAHWEGSSRLRNGLSVCVLGGGDFGVVHELTRYEAVKSVRQVDWDLEFCELAKEYLECIHHGAWQDPRLQIEVEKCNAFEFLPGSSEKYDVIFGDLTDLSNVNGLMPDFASLISPRLNPGGIFITQAGELSNVPSALAVSLEGYASLKGNFKRFWISRTHIPSFGYEQSFILATDDEQFNPLALSPSELDALINKSVKGELSEYSGAVHHGMFAISPRLKGEICRILGKSFCQ